MRKLKSIRGGNDGPPATTAQLIAMEFAAIKELKHLSTWELQERVFDSCNIVRRGAAVAMNILSQDKAELVEMLALPRRRVTTDALFQAMDDALDFVQEIREDIRSAQARLMVAAAIVEGDDGGKFA